MEHYMYALFGGLMIISGAMTIIVSNPVHSVFYLILAFVNASGMLILLDVEYIAIIFLIVYVGAVSILFLFVVMMFNIKEREEKARYMPIGLIIAIVLLYEFERIIANTINISTDQLIRWRDWSGIIVNNTNVEQVGQGLYTNFGYSFLIAGCVLLVAMVGAIVLTVDHQKEIQRQSLYAQVATSSQSRFYRK